MKILAVDTCTDYLSVAVCDGPAVLVENSILAQRRHAERIVCVIDATLDEAGLQLREIDALAVAVGPGSFTGLRIGVSAMKGLADGAGLPLVGVSSLDAMTRLLHTRDALVCPMLDARMDEIYGAVYRYRQGVREVVRPAMVGPVEALLEGLDESPIVFGEGAQNYASRIRAVLPNSEAVPGHLGHPRGSAVAQEAIAALAAGAQSDPALVRPVYLRQSQPEEARRRAARKAVSV